MKYRYYFLFVTTYFAVAVVAAVVAAFAAITPVGGEKYPSQMLCLKYCVSQPMWQNFSTFVRGYVQYSYYGNRYGTVIVMLYIYDTVVYKYVECTYKDFKCNIVHTL